MWSTVRFSLVFLLVSPVVAAQSTDRAGALYSTQIRFDNRNVPVVTIGIMDGQKRIELSTPGSLTLLTEGPGGTEIVTVAGKRWTVRVEGGVPAKTSWRVRLAGFPANDLEEIAEARKAWKAKKLTVRPLELGSVFGFFGKVLDSRQILLVTEKRFGTRAEAESAATALAAEHEVETGVVPRLEERPTGMIVLSDGQTTVRARDVLWLRPTAKKASVTVHQVEFGRGFNWHGRQDRQFGGTLYVAVDPTGKLAIANMVPSETLLRGLVPSEIYPTAPAAALRAQAVSARGELLAKIGLRHLADPFLICSDVHCQVYAGLSREDERTSRAVKETAGQMLFHDDRLVDTVYSASCGGHTEHNENVWGGKPESTLRGTPDGRDALGEPTEAAVRRWVTTHPKTHCGNGRFGAKSYRWKKTVGVDRVRRGLQAIGKDRGVVRKIEVLKRGVSGRAIEVRFTGTRGKVTVAGELVIRRVLGGLKSSLFVVDPTNGPNGKPVSFRFTGGGFGHGVGLCQTGAIGMALEGKSFQEILRHYYRGAKVDRIY